MGKKALVLSSGGIDSTTCLALAVKELGAENVASLSIFYGQKHRVELRAAHAVAEFYGIRQYEFDMSQILRFSNCASEPGNLSFADSTLTPSDHAMVSASTLRYGLKASI